MSKSIKEIRAGYISRQTAEERTRSCPKCGDGIIYSRIDVMQNAEKLGKPCKKCVNESQRATQEVEPESRVCRKCKETKNLKENFAKLRGGKWGYRAECKECKKKDDDSYLERNREAVNSRAKERYQIKVKESPESLIWDRAQSRSRKLGLPFNITIEDIVIPEFCPILGIKLNVGLGKVSDASPSLDKVIPGLGYVRGNIQVISNRANRIKTDATLNELKKVYEFYKGLLGEPPNE